MKAQAGSRLAGEKSAGATSRSCAGWDPGVGRGVEPRGRTRGGLKEVPKFLRHFRRHGIAIALERALRRSGADSRGWFDRADREERGSAKEIHDQSFRSESPGMAWTSAQQLVENDVARLKHSRAADQPGWLFALDLLGTHADGRARQLRTRAEVVVLEGEPKSARQGLPEASIRMLAGLMSR